MSRAGKGQKKLMPKRAKKWIPFPPHLQLRDTLEHIMASTSASTSTTSPSDRKATSVLVIGMAGSGKSTFAGAQVFLVAILAVRLAVVLDEQSRVEPFVAHDTGETRLVIGFRGWTNHLFGKVDGSVASRTLWCCWYSEARHVAASRSRVAVGRDKATRALQSLRTSSMEWLGDWRSERRRDTLKACLIG